MKELLKSACIFSDHTLWDLRHSSRPWWGSWLRNYCFETKILSYLTGSLSSYIINVLLRVRCVCLLWLFTLFIYALPYITTTLWILIKIISFRREPALCMKAFRQRPSTVSCSWSLKGFQLNCLDHGSGSGNEQARQTTTMTADLCGDAWQFGDVTATTTRHGRLHRRRQTLSVGPDMPAGDVDFFRPPQQVPSEAIQPDRDHTRHEPPTPPSSRKLIK